MNCFDFDKTIYRKDCSVQFYLYCYFHVRSIYLFFSPVIICWLLLLRLFRVIDTTKLKEKCFSFLKHIKNIDSLVESFWIKEKKHINHWYYETMKDDDVVCSASPEFLVAPIMKQINPLATVIGTNMDKSTGKITGNNVKGKEKVVVLNTMGFTEFENVYTDSLSDFPILDMGKQKYIVCGTIM